MKAKTTCPWCGHPASVRVDGRMNKHGYAKNAYDMGSHRPKSCEGSGRSANPGNENLARPALRLRIGTVE